MPVGDVISRPHFGRYAAKLTSQQIADFMLHADWERRDALAGGDLIAAAKAQAEIDKLAAMLP